MFRDPEEGGVGIIIYDKLTVRHVVNLCDLKIARSNVMAYSESCYVEFLLLVNSSCGSLCHHLENAEL